MTTEPLRLTCASASFALAALGASIPDAHGAELRDTAADGYIRFGVGLGHGVVTETGSVDGLQLPRIHASGLAIGIFGEAGLAVFERLSIFTRFAGGGMSEPSLSFAGQSVASEGIQVNAVSFGAGSTVHLPAGFQIGALLGFGVAAVQSENEDENFYGESDAGFLYGFDAGWQLYLTSRFALGAQFRYFNINANDGPSATIDTTHWIVSPTCQFDF